MSAALRVGVDATSWSNRRGFGRFIRNAIGRLVELDGDTHYSLFMDSQAAADADTLPGSVTRRVVVHRNPERSGGASRPVGDLARLTGAVTRGRFDVFVFPSVYTYFPVLWTPSVVGVHDVIANQLPELTLPSRRARALWSAKERLAVRRAAAVFTVSEASRQAVAEHFTLRPDEIAVVPEAPDPIFGPRDEGAVRHARAAVGLEDTGEFVLFVGGISPHKNIETLLEAYARLAETLVQVPPLVLVGDLDGDPYVSSTGSVRQRIAALDLVRDVLLPGFVSDERLACLYCGATVVVLPSLAEGFGLPAVEAAVCGATLVVSDLPAHRESLGDAALYFPPTDGARLHAQLSRALGDADLRRALGAAARRAVADRSWDRAAERLHEIVAAVAAGPTRR
jgi:glycosyltransferase involved in cell wall biosynthesis